MLNQIKVLRGSSDPFSYTVELSSDGVTWQVVSTAPVSSAGFDEFPAPVVETQFVRLVTTLPKYRSADSYI